MKIELRYFASVREALGLAAESLELPPQVETAGQLRQFLQTRGLPWQQVLDQQRALRVAQNQVVCDWNTPLQAGAEVAFFPPVTGG